jgi:hypothetical protein
MPTIEWLRYEAKKASRNLFHGWYDSAIARCGVLSMYLAYVLLRSNGMITIRNLTDIEAELCGLGGQDDWLKLLLKRGVLTSDQAEILWQMAQYRIRHSPHLFNLPRYVGAHCLVDGIRTVNAFHTLLNDNNFVAKIPEDSVPECVWGFWLG